MSDANLDALRRGDLAGARELRLTGLGLREFPPEILGLADTLEVLDLGGNALTDLPAGIACLRRLKILFLSGNPMRRLPPALGGLPALSQLGARGCGTEEVPGEALPPALRWLTLTGNAIATMPEELGKRPALQKLMLAGNHLSALPEALAGAANLELIRLSANRLEALPPWLAALPRLAWIAWAGNPLDPLAPGLDAADIPWSALEPAEILGQGASGLVRRATWRAGEGPRPVALKLFKGAMTSDGLPEREMEACLRAGAHPNLPGALGRLKDHPEGLHGLVMPLLPETWRPLAGPPSPDSCSRDAYDPALRLLPDAALRLARATAAAAAHLHARGLLHGDLYAHNTLWDGEKGEAVLSDFGAASRLPPGAAGIPWQRVEVRAWGILLGEILDRCPPLSADPALRALARRCTAPDPAARALMQDALHALGD
ncbi:leucine-rich repeat-containing protein kinase family protein [Roseomonas populi]|uniref:Leucine-rich repeat-containing serine/threonine-protein kinase n=1 Tax=Roseomonas populi TaxID=3121582 RepID=A0ABT1X0X3_9PROT|nr:leucine-rich repeat-containing protein kinase family protein [Roseomonas pecuniae]MCR0981748.1 leucine-rich repeat-containing serine/threonine-protein kinase [Roseomonas pecuniae]